MKVPSQGYKDKKQKKMTIYAKITVPSVSTGAQIT